MQEPNREPGDLAAGVRWDGLPQTQMIIDGDPPQLNPVTPVEMPSQASRLSSRVQPVGLELDLLHLSINEQDRGAKSVDGNTIVRVWHHDGALVFNVQDLLNTIEEAAVRQGVQTKVPLDEPDAPEMAIMLPLSEIWSIEHLNDIVDSASNGITHWAEVEVQTPGILSIVPADEEILESFKDTLLNYQDGDRVQVTVETVLRGMAAIFGIPPREDSLGYFWKDLRQMIVSGDAGDIDADDADILVQFGLFNAALFS